MSISVANPPGPVSSIQPYLIAFVRGVNANSLATTTMNWNGSNGAGNTFPLFARVLGKSGTLALLVANIRLNGVVIQPITALNSALLGAGTDPITYVLNTTTSASIIPASGNWDIVVGTINGSAATIDVEIYGWRISQ